jgi:hypothetical protein
LIAAFERNAMSPTSSTHPGAGRSLVGQFTRWAIWLSAPLLSLGALTAGCQNDRLSGLNRLPPSQELQRLSDEEPERTVDPRRMSKETLETRDGVKALKDVEKNGVRVED